MPETKIVGPHRPLIEPTPDDLQKLEAWAGDGYALIELARGLGVSKDTLTRWRRDHESVRDALEAGKAREHKMLRSKLMDKALDGDTVALLFLLKTRHGYREGGEVSDARTHVVINLPGAMPLSQFIAPEDEA